MSDSGSQPHPAYCEEYSEEAQTTVPETKQSANIAAKRSKPVHDEFSDSGYSTNTHGTLGSSLNSKLEAAQSNAQQAAAVGRDAPATTATKASQSRAQSPTKDTSKKIELRSRRDGNAPKKDCSCDKCLAAARRTAPPLDIYGPPNHILAQPRKRTPAPPSPQSRRGQLPPDAPPLHEHIRPRAATSSRALPISFHEGTAPNSTFMSHPASQPIYIERQPSSRHSTIYPFPPPSYPPQQTSYFQPAPPPPVAPAGAPQEFYPPMPLPYEVNSQPQLRPRPQQWNSELHLSRPQSIYYGSPPIVQPAEPIYKTIEPSHPPLERQISRRKRRTSLREAHSAPDQDRKRMLPPPLPPSRIDTKSRQEQRPAIRHATTTSAACHELRHRVSGYDSTEGRVSKHNSRKPSFDEDARSRRPSLARSSKTSDEKTVSFEAVERDMNRLKLEEASAKSRRRSSVYGHESLEQLEGSVEAYQASKGAMRSQAFMPTHEEVMRLMRKKTNPSSETGSRASAHSKGSRGSREDSDTKPHKSLDQKPSNDVNARNDSDRFALRFNPEGINVKMQGGIEGRAINLRKSKDGDGDIELSIESRASVEARGRTLGGRPTLKDKSHKRYSYYEGQGVKELEGPQQGASRTLSRARMELGEEDEPRIVGERIITTTRSRRSSRYRYDGRREVT
ncbi:MAG: hypothetical protein Q9217_001996 [Psora testacea]